MDKNILIIGLNSELAQDTIKELKQSSWNIYATSRQIGMMDEKVREFHLDVTNEMDFIHLKEKFQEIKFDVILNFAGIAIAGAVEELDELELKKQFDVNYFGLLRIIKYFSPKSLLKVCALRLLNTRYSSRKAFKCTGNFIKLPSAFCLAL